MHGYGSLKRRITGIFQWWANPNLDLDLNPDLTTFTKSSGFGFGLDLSFFKGVDLKFDSKVL